MADEKQISAVTVHRPAASGSIVRTYAEVERAATACAASGYYRDVKDAAQATVKMIAGLEMGIGPIRALAEIHIVEGKPTAAASLIAANVKKSGRYDYRVKERSDDVCALEFFENGQSVGVSTFSMQDAERAGLAGRANWKKYPRAMLFARALTEGVRVYCPDAAHGVIYTPDELAPGLEVTESGEPIGMQAPDPTPGAEPRDVNPPPEPKLNASDRTALLSEMEARLMAVGQDPELAGGCLRSILAGMGYRSSTECPQTRLDEIADEIQAWEPPSEAGQDFALEGGES